MRQYPVWWYSFKPVINNKYLHKKLQLSNIKDIHSPRRNKANSQTNEANPRTNSRHWKHIAVYTMKTFMGDKWPHKTWKKRSSTKITNEYIPRHAEPPCDHSKYDWACWRLTRRQLDWTDVVETELPHTATAQRIYSLAASTASPWADTETRSSTIIGWHGPLSTTHSCKWRVHRGRDSVHLSWISC